MTGAGTTKGCWRIFVDPLGTGRQCVRHAENGDHLTADGFQYHREA